MWVTHISLIYVMFTECGFCFHSATVRMVIIMSGLKNTKKELSVDECIRFLILNELIRSAFLFNDLVTLWNKKKPSYWTCYNSKCFMFFFLQNYSTRRYLFNLFWINLLLRHLTMVQIREIQFDLFFEWSSFLLIIIIWYKYCEIFICNLLISTRHSRWSDGFVAAQWVFRDWLLRPHSTVSVLALFRLPQLFGAINSSFTEMIRRTIQTWNSNSLQRILNELRRLWISIQKVIAYFKFNSHPEFFYTTDRCSQFNLILYWLILADSSMKLFPTVEWMKRFSQLKHWFYSLFE